VAIQFRKEVLAAQSRDWLGSVEIASPISRWVLATMVAVVTALAGCFLCLGTYTQRQRVSGELVPSAGLVAVPAGRPGSVTRVLVSQGQHVHAGQTLVELGGDTSSAALGETMQAVSGDLQSKRRELLANLDTQRQIASDRSTAASAASASLRSQIVQINDQYALEEDRISRQQALIDKLRPLVATGIVSRLQMSANVDQLLSAKSQLRALERQRLGLQQQLTNAEQTQRQIPLDLEREAHSTEGQVADVSQAIAENESNRLALIVAPTDGLVTALLAQPGQSIKAGQTLLNIMPAGSTLRAQLLVPSRAIGFIDPGSRVVIRYQAYPYQKFGQHAGTVANVSRSALSPYEIQQLTGTTADASMYRVDVKLDSPYLLTRGIKHSLMPGMVLDADILLEKRTLLEWAFEPLYGLRQKLHQASGRAL